MPINRKKFNFSVFLKYFPIAHMQKFKLFFNFLRSISNIWANFLAIFIFILFVRIVQSKKEEKKINFNKSPFVSKETSIKKLSISDIVYISQNDFPCDAQGGLWTIFYSLLLKLTICHFASRETKKKEEVSISLLNTDGYLGHRIYLNDEQKYISRWNDKMFPVRRPEEGIQLSDLFQEFSFDFE